MGMDFISTMVVSEKDADLDWDAGTEAANKLIEDDVDLNWLENFMYEIEVDDDDNVTNMDEVRERVVAAIESVRGHIEGYSRIMNVWNLWDRTIYVFGESSWGDADDVFDDVGILDVAPKVMEAIGFMTSFEGKVVPA